jgi:cystathionine beta-lyase
MYGPKSSQFVRLNYATSPTILTEAIDRIVKSL